MDTKTLLNILKTVKSDITSWEMIGELYKSGDIESWQIEEGAKWILNPPSNTVEIRVQNESIYIPADIDPMMDKCRTKLEDGSSCQNPALRGAKCKEHKSYVDHGTAQLSKIQPKTYDDTK